MFIDSLTAQMSLLIVINITVAALLLELSKRTVAQERLKGYGLVFLGIAIPSIIIALSNSLNWPLPGSYNIIFGDMFLYFSILALMGGMLLYKMPKQLDLISIPFFLFGAFSALYGVVIYTNNLTSQPTVSSSFFVLEGVGALLASISFNNKKPVLLKTSLAIFILATLALAAIDIPAILSHVSAFAKWQHP